MASLGFLLKKIVGTLLMPLPLALVIGTLGWIVWRQAWSAAVARGGLVEGLGGNQAERVAARLGPGLVGAALVILWIGSCGPVSKTALRALEDDHPLFPGDSVAAVVVLGAGYTADPSAPLSAWPSEAAIVRLVEGLRIAEAQPWTELYVSGSGGPDGWSSARVYRDLAVALGFDSTRIVVDRRARDTDDEARLWAPRLEGRRFALVTSASHMPRAMALFRGQGLDPVAAPTGHGGIRSEVESAWRWVPGEASLERARTVWHEVLGRIWATLTGAG